MQRLFLKGDELMKNKGIKRFFSLFISAALVFALCVNVSATRGAIGWYCVHRSDHKQPIADDAISYIEDFGGYYIDKNHGDDSSDKVIFLTFDAGYENGNISKILDVMKEEEVTGAFFILGNLVEKNPDLVRRMFEEGHLVCNHTYSHATMVNKSMTEIKGELERLENACRNKTGYDMAKYYRPPESKFDETSLKCVNELGYKTIFWSFGYVDWENNNQPSPEKAKNKIMSNIHNGEIMLLHPTSATNALILGDVIRDLKAQGFRFGTLDELTNECSQ